MTSDVHIATSNGSYEIYVNTESITWNIEPGVVQLTPASFKVLREVFGDKRIPNFLIYFGKCAEKLLLEVNFPTDDSFRDFRKFMLNYSYFASGVVNGTSRTYIEWGSAGDAFNGTWENTVMDNGVSTSNVLGKGLIGPVTVTKNIPSGTWKGTMTFYLGEQV